MINKINYVYVLELPTFELYQKLKFMIKKIEVVVNPLGFTDWDATRKRNHEKCLKGIEQRLEEYRADPSLWLKDLMKAGILDENANFTKPYTILNQLKQAQ